MERVTEQRQVAVGFYADIPQAFWRRVTRYHIPVKWFAWKKKRGLSISTGAARMLAKRR